eukprot:TRINITY_DN1481_c0_g1_i20.p1 TRINITY_DN1481_c0_g1~~TRINITY_DN1481_c0_g1_i20.p1  ORF type:complete len:196 (-),score=21.54 TRINITY_DN1481_c0_g1_i20:117-704(-)
MRNYKHSSMRSLEAVVSTQSTGRDIVFFFGTTMLSSRTTVTKRFLFAPLLSNVQARSITPKYNNFGSPISAKIERPISPHVAIYAFPLPAVTSIINRVTGFLMGIGFGLAGGVALVNPALIPCGIAFVKAYPLLHFATKLIIAFPFSVHTIAGLRHYYWDTTSKGLNSIAEFDSSSRLVLWSSITLALLLASLSF